MIQCKEKMSMFAVHYILDGGEVCQILTGIFYACVSINGSKPPCRCLMALLPSRCNATGKVEPSFFATYTNKSKMHKLDICLNGRITPNSNHKFNLSLRVATAIKHLITSILRPCALCSRAVLASIY